MDQRRQYFSGSSSHGVQNSIEKTLTQPSQLISFMVESKQHNSQMAEYAREFRESCARILELLQEEIDVAESTNKALPTSEETLLSIEPSDEQSVEESIGLRTSTVESVTPVARMPLLNEITDAFPKGITRFVDTPNLAILVFDLSSCKGVVVHLFSILIKSPSSNFDPPPLPPPKPPDRSFQKIIVELHVICNLMMPLPPTKPPYAIHGDVDITVLLSCVEIVCANKMVIKTELSTDYDHCILKEDLVDGNRYDDSILELDFVPFTTLILYVKCSESFAHKVAIYIFRVWKMTVVCSDSLNVGFITASVLDGKELLFCEFDDVSGSTLIVLYTKHGGIQYAFNRFERLPAQVVVALYNFIGCWAIIGLNKLVSYV